MDRGWLAPAVVVVGVGVIVLGCIEPTIIGGGARPYAYISVVAVGAMLTIFGTLMWRDR